MQTNRALAVVTLVGAFMVGSFAIAIAGGGALPDTNGAAVYKFITKTDPYQQWALFPGKDKLYKGKHPHGALLTTYVNEVALTGINGKGGTLANGSIIVKENFMPNKMLGAVTVMYRVDSYNPDAGDWFWAKYKADGKIAKEGKVAGCISCHTAAINNDWIFTGPVK